MWSKTKRSGIMLASLLLLSAQSIKGQDKISWLDDYTGEIYIGNESYRYNFTHVDGNDCKLKFEELHTNKKGNTAASSWIFYLTDIDPSAIGFKAKGKSINLTIETYRSQKFISYYEGEELEDFTEKIVITMNEVDMARSFIEILKEKLTFCTETQLVWENPNQAFNWLMDNVGEAMDDGTEWVQAFNKGQRDYLAEFEAKSVNSKGEQLSSKSIFDLSDIDPMAINLKISGKSLRVEVPVKESKKYIEVKSPAGSQFTPKLLIYTNEIEEARQIVNALYYLVNNTIPERPTWDSYSSSLEFVKNNLGEFTLDFESSPSGLVNLAVVKTESDGTSEHLEYAFYLTDIAEHLKLEVSRSSINIGITTKEKHEYIRELKDGKVSDYASSLNFHVADIDGARDILNAFEYAIGASEEKIEDFTSMGQIESWCSENIGQIEIGEDTYTQNLTYLKELDNQMIVESKLTKADGESTDSKFILYPEDISLDKLDIKVSGKKLYVLLQTDKGKYVKKYESGSLQTFINSSQVLFYDPLLAKNFMAAVRYLQENSVDEERAGMPKEEAMAFILENIQNLELSDKKYEQIMKVGDDGACAMTFTRVETDSKGSGRKYQYEFTLSDIDPLNSKFTIKGAVVIINLLTIGGEKLIKPYKDEEAGDFVDEFLIYADDVLLAKKMLGAFAALSEECK